MEDILPTLASYGFPAIMAIMMWRYFEKQQDVLSAHLNVINQTLPRIQSALEEITQQLGRMKT